MIVKYVAFDGTEFTDNIECQNYEQQQYEILKKNNHILMLDIMLKKTNDIDMAIFINIITEQDLQTFRILSEHEKLPYPDRIGMFYYNSEDDIWESLTEEILVLEQRVKQFKKIENLLNTF